MTEARAKPTVKKKVAVKVQVKGVARRKAAQPEEPQVFASVFDAIADTPEESANLKARADLIRRISSIVRTRGWTQEEAAHHCRVTQPRISDLMNGRLSKFSLDALVNIASRLGRVSVELTELEYA